MAIEKVLVVDDSKTDLVYLQKIVSDAGCEVITARNGKEAVARARSERPDLIFMDIVMDEMDGYEATRLLTNDPDTQDIPVVFVSSKRQKADRVWAKMQGGKDLVSKPYTPEQIVEQINVFRGH
jgi:twitching motility two-component system response regulator PilH